MSEDFSPFWTQLDGLPVYAVASKRNPARDGDVVPVHGLGLSGTYLMPTARELATDYRVWVPDPPGFGQPRSPARRRSGGAFVRPACDADAAATYSGCPGCAGPICRGRIIS